MERLRIYRDVLRDVPEAVHDANDVIRSGDIPSQLLSFEDAVDVDCRESRVRFPRKKIRVGG